MTGRWRHRLAGAVLRRAVRGGAAETGEWGEAMLAELAAMPGRAALRWALGGVRWSLSQRLSRWSAGPGPVGERSGLRLALAALIGVGVSLVVSQAVAFAYVPSGSMEPTLRVGDRLMVDEVGFRVTGLRHGDLVLVRREGQAYSKRVIGLPGDRIRCSAGVLRRNGAPVAEPYLRPDTVTACDPVTVPAGAVYLLGDDRDASIDSRKYGPVDAGTISGRVITTFRLPF